MATITYNGLSVGSKAWYSGDIEAGIKEVTVIGATIDRTDDGGLKATWYEVLDDEDAETSADPDELFESFEEAAKDAYAYARLRVVQMKKDVGERLQILAKIEAAYYEKTGKELQDVALDGQNP
jgi:hypothetical protein